MLENFRANVLKTSSTEDKDVIWALQRQRARCTTLFELCSDARFRNKFGTRNIPQVFNRFLI